MGFCLNSSPASWILGRILIFWASLSPPVKRRWCYLPHRVAGRIKRQNLSEMLYEGIWRLGLFDRVFYCVYKWQFWPFFLRFHTINASICYLLLFVLDFGSPLPCFYPVYPLLLVPWTSAGVLNTLYVLSRFLFNTLLSPFHTWENWGKGVICPRTQSKQVLTSRLKSK